jgi:hypothetical protein
MPQFILLLLMFLTGCASLAEKERADKLERLMNGYTRTMEWSDFSRALLYRKPTADKPPPDLAPYANIKISDYRPSQAVPGPDKNTMMRTVKVRYIQLQRMSEYSLTTQEVWQFSEKDDRWFLMSDLPSFPR